ncbi:hypothetical protein Pfo_023572 [Paulownia fortunei]|nr:hypothetical protein Pfo_023572 [Paulownia fortunei]
MNLPQPRTNGVWPKASRTVPSFAVPPSSSLVASSSSEHAAKPEETTGSGSGECSEAPPPLGSDQLLLYRGLKKAKKERA